MRISDWSSDVCSSDLVGLQAVCEHFIGKLLCLLASPSEHRFENRRGRQEDLSTPEFVDNNPCHLARADDRSEEHTSELQSLMRISYAVFCLKTKKHTTVKYTQHQYARAYTYSK